jgi:hypothetical protein
MRLRITLDVVHMFQRFLNKTLVPLSIVAPQFFHFDLYKGVGLKCLIREYW